MGDVENIAMSLLGETEDARNESDTEPLVRHVCSKRSKNKWSVVLLSTLAAVSGFMFGYDTGIISGAMLLIVIDLDLEGEIFIQEIIVSATIIGCVVGAATSKFITEGMGRRAAILVAAAIFTAGAIVMGSARILPDTLYVLIAGRFIVGVGVGLASTATPLYISEVAPPDVRGKLVTLNIVFVTFGSFCAAAVAALLSKVNYPHGWELMLGLSGVPSALQFIGMLFQIESPRWLAKHKGVKNAFQALLRVRTGGVDDVKLELDEIQRSLKEEERLNVEAFAFLDLFRTRKMRSILLLGAGLQAIQQLAGVNTVMYYTGTIVKYAGWTDVTEAIWMTVGIAFLGFVGCCLGMTQIDKRGRRCLLLTSLSGVVVSLSMLGFSFYMLETSSSPARAASPDICDYDSCYACISDADCGFCGSLCVAGNDTLASNSSMCDQQQYYGNRCDYKYFNWGYVAVASVTLFLAFFNAGMGPIPWVVNAEIFPFRAKSIGTSFTTSVNWTFNFLISISFLHLTEAISRFGAFWLYGLIACFGLVWFALALPETQGKKLEDIEALFESEKVQAAVTAPPQASSSFVTNHASCDEHDRHDEESCA